MPAPKIMAIETEPNSLSSSPSTYICVTQRRVYTFNMMMNVVCKYTRAPNDSDEASKWKFCSIFCFLFFTLKRHRQPDIWRFSSSLARLLQLKMDERVFPPACVCAYLKCLLHACALALNWICSVADDDDMSIQNQLNSTHRTQSPFVRMCGKNANTFSAESLGGVLKLRELYFDILIFLILCSIYNGSMSENMSDDLTCLRQRRLIEIFV